MNWLRTGDGNVGIRSDRVTVFDVSEMENLVLTVTTPDGEYTCAGIHAIDACMILCPSALEGKRMRWHRHVWSFHNLVGHPLMQVLAFAGHHELALWVHDVTVPRPRIP